MNGLPISNPKAVLLFEQLAEATWAKLAKSWNYNISISEETFTDLNLLEIEAASLPNVRVWKSNKQEESLKGIDWEWWIGSNRLMWWRYAVQAKKVTQSGKYDSIRKKVKNRFQIDLLHEYAKKSRAIPLYCFYNHVEDRNVSPFWHCNFAIEPEQFGCTLAPLDIVKYYFVKGRRKSFHTIHREPKVLPWRCLLKCPLVLEQNQAPHFLASDGFADIAPYPSIPIQILQKFRGQIQVSDEGRVNLQQDPDQIIPKRTLLIDLDGGNPVD